VDTTPSIGEDGVELHGWTLESCPHRHIV